jgi:hypothetical protein
MTLAVLISLIIGSIGAIGAIPLILKAFFYLLYKPDIRIFFPPINNLPSIQSGGIVGNRNLISGIHIVNKSGKHLSLRAKLMPDRPVKWTSDANRFGYVTVQSGKFVYVPYFLSGDGRTWSEEGELPSDFYECALPFPFETSEGFTLEVILYPKIALSEFKLPRFFGNLELKSTVAHFQIAPRAR